MKYHVKGYDKDTSKFLIKALNKLSKEYEVNVVFFKKMKSAGVFDFQKNTIRILLDYKNDISSCLTTFFHELGHKYCREKGLWKSYHRTENFESIEEIKAFISISFKVEKWVDNWAEEEMKKHYKKYKFEVAYRTDRDRIWLINYHKHFIKKYYKIDL